ncbi:MAG: hypothetical protein FJ207_02885 [Gemmatimonadetes bacterium]|nr:hypothetical protein [Gemmatimonadota bacterium]
MSDPTQSFEHHAKFVPAYHYWMTALLVLPTLWFGFRAASDFSVDRLVFALFAVGVVLAGFLLRFFPLGVQDRLIRLEERLRMERILPPDLRARIPELTTSQLVGLRFASDEELAELVRRVLDQGMTDRKQIKRAVRSWRADHQRI